MAEIENYDKVVILRPGDYCLSCLADETELVVVEWESTIGMPTLRGTFCEACVERRDHEKWLTNMFNTMDSDGLLEGIPLP